MFSWYKYLIVSLVFSHLGFWSGNLLLIAPFPDHCLLVPFFSSRATSSQLVICIRYFIKTSNIYVTLEISNVAYFNFLKGVLIVRFGK